MAGMIDAEGCVGIVRDTYRKTPAYRLQLSVAGTDEALFDWLCERFGGFVCKVKRYSDRHIAGFQWYLTGKAAAELLRNLNPYLVIKQPQVDVACDLIDHWAQLPVTGEKRANELARRHRCYEAMAELNRKGGQYAVNVMPTRGKLTPSQHDLDYLAGVVDGDGSIIIGKSHKRRADGSIFPKHELKLVVTNTSDVLIRWLSSRFGGHFVIAQRNSRWKSKIDWKLNGASAAKLLELIGPSLLIKGDQSRVAVEFIDNMQRLTRGSSRTDVESELDRREALYQTMRRLNQRGDAAATTKHQAPTALSGEAIV